MPPYYTIHPLAIIVRTGTNGQHTVICHTRIVGTAVVTDLQELIRAIEDNEIATGRHAKDRILALDELAADLWPADEPA